ncbi:cupin domain protein [Plectosphaerella plurivora]|uniref:Cupin domain protein n=1 Tax=Plectosphaerella plurivora TaxID=936078 RepID=A0A9P8VHY8_9PEZI|nr:cupin domain protein [Plectosphaerella plurivora]
MPPAQSVNCHLLAPTADAPNNRLPVLHYRGVLPWPLSEASVVEFLTANKWEHRGTWGHIDLRHFHPNSHECYGIFQGTSTLLIGQIEAGNGAKIHVAAGDVIVLPAGTAHSSLESSSDYRYIGVYPQGCPRWRNEFGKNDPDSFRDVIDQVGMPEADPVYGENGPLMQLWDLKKPLSKL